MTGANTIAAVPPRYHFTHEQRIAWIRLIRSENVGPATFRDLINHCGSAQTALDMLPQLAKRGGKMATIRVASAQQAEAELEATEKAGFKIVAIGEPDYPPLMRTMDQPPPLVTLAGNADVFKRPATSIVGSRNASMAGLKMTRILAGDLADSGHAIISGLARGIDAAAHQASLARGTVAVLAGGLDRPYPPENIKLLQAIIHEGNGAAITEQPFGWEPRARDFPKRNRLIAGLALGLVVVEAAAKSGTLISARLAAEMGRIVMAVPGSPLDPRAQGTNTLIRNGAELITSAQDVLDAVMPSYGDGKGRVDENLFLEPEDTMTMPPPEGDRARIISLLSPVPTDIDDIIVESGAEPSQVFLVLLELEIAGRLERHSGNRVSMLAEI